MQTSDWFCNKWGGVDSFAFLLINNFENITLDFIHFVKYKARLFRANGFSRINFVIVNQFGLRLVAAPSYEMTCKPVLIMPQAMGGVYNILFL